MDTENTEHTESTESLVEPESIDLTTMYSMVPKEQRNIAQIKRFSVMPEPLKLFEANKHAPNIESFNTDSTDYNRRVAHFLSVVAGWTYADPDTFTAKLQHYGLHGAHVTPLECINEAMTIVAKAYFVMTKERVGILSFRGTEPVNIINWLTDANTVMEPFMGGEIHSGFLNNTKALWSQISNCINSAPEMESLYITGHSLGAAMAGVTAIKMSQDHKDWWKKVKGVYTFGQPMIANRGLAKLSDKSFGQMFFRHVYSRDLVPRVPTRDLGQFAHFGIERFANTPFDQWTIREKKQQVKQAYYITTTMFGVGFSFLEKRLRLPLLDNIARFASNELFLSMDDHSPVTYIDTCSQSM